MTLRQRIIDIMYPELTEGIRIDLNKVADAVIAAVVSEVLELIDKCEHIRTKNGLDLRDSHELRQAIEALKTGSPDGEQGDGNEHEK